MLVVNLESLIANLMRSLMAVVDMEVLQKEMVALSENSSSPSLSCIYGIDTHVYEDANRVSYERLAIWQSE